MSKYSKLSTLFRTDEVINKDGKSLTLDEALGDDCEYVAIYFSAHWCPPCKRFTPVLSEYFKKHGTSKKLKIIFATSDQDEDQFMHYFHSMGWNIAFPFGSTAINTLSKKYNVRGIPTLVLLDKDGTLITEDFRSKVEKDPEAKQFPSNNSNSSSSSSSSSPTTATTKDDKSKEKTSSNAGTGKNNSTVKKEPGNASKIMDFISAIGIFITVNAVVRYFYPRDKYIGITVGAAVAAWLLGGNFK